MEFDTLVEKLLKSKIRNDLLIEANENNQMLTMIRNQIKQSGDGKLTSRNERASKKQIALYKDCITFMRVIDNAGIGDEQFTAKGNDKKLDIKVIKKAYDVVMRDFEVIFQLFKELSKDRYDRNPYIGAVKKAYDLFKQIDLNDTDDMDKPEWKADAREFGTDKDGHILTRNIPRLDKNDFDENGEMIRKLEKPFKQSTFRRDLIMAISHLRSEVNTPLIDDVLPDAPDSIKKRFNELTFKDKLTQAEVDEVNGYFRRYNGKTSDINQTAKENTYRAESEGLSDEEAKKKQKSSYSALRNQKLKNEREGKRREAIDKNININKIAEKQTTTSFGKVVKAILNKWIENNAPTDTNHKFILYGKMPTGYASAARSTANNLLILIPASSIDTVRAKPNSKPDLAIKEIKGLEQYKGYYCIRIAKDFSFTQDQAKYIDNRRSAKGHLDPWKIEFQKWLGVKSIVTEDIFNY